MICGKCIKFAGKPQLMYPALLTAHSLIRYLLLIFLLVVIVKAFFGFLNKRAYTKLDNTLGLTLFSLTHTQLLLGLILYFYSPFVLFSGSEHLVIMMIAVGLNTAARSTSKKMTDDTAKHKRLFVFNTIALVVIIIGIAMTRRGFFSLPGVSG
jgi:hypothetical protein